MSASEHVGAARLVALCGPAVGPVELSAKAGGLVVGRQDQCDIRLPSDMVSRVHVRLNCEGGRWTIVDLKSRWGTFLNGIKLEENREVPLSEGDLIRITPWTFSFTMQTGRRRGVESHDDVERVQTMVREVSSAGGGIADDLLALLLESAAGMHGAADEKALAEVMLDAATRGTGLPNAAVLRPLDDAGRVDVLASRRTKDDARAMFSRALLRAAAGGAVVELSGMNGPVTSESIVMMQIDTAICVPLMLGQTVAAYLYLDSRGGRAPARIRPSATAFCVGLGRIAGLALANLKRIDIERRQAMVEAELAAGAEAQRWVMPPREQRIGRFEYVGESRPGRSMGGDFFDVIPLDENRIAVALADVSGKGVAASVLMTAAQGFLHAALREHGQPERAVADLNKYVVPRRPGGKFITLWVGVFDGNNRIVRYVDAGHGYGIFIGRDKITRILSEKGGIPVGLSAEAVYNADAAELTEGGRVLVLSDGIVEQPAGSGPGHKQFGMDGVWDCLRSLADKDDVAALFDAVTRHAGGARLADDATAVMVRWDL